MTAVLRPSLPMYILGLLLFFTMGMDINAQGQGTGERPLSEQYFLGTGYLDLPQARAPFVPFGDNRILFSFDPGAVPSPASYGNMGGRRTDSPVSLVQVAFSHEDYRVLHPMAKNERGIYLYLYTLDRPTRTSLLEANRDIQYRFIVDGVWMADPANPLRDRRLNGTILSTFRISSMPPLAMISPELGATAASMRVVTLRYQGQPGQEIFVGASFNGFDPYLHMMKEQLGSPGVYELQIRLRPGRYVYYYVVDGRKIMDPLNNLRGFSPDGKEYSRVDVVL